MRRMWPQLPSGRHFVTTTQHCWNLINWERQLKFGATRETREGRENLSRVAPTRTILQRVARRTQSPPIGLHQVIKHFRFAVHSLECYVCGSDESPCGPANKDKRTCDPASLEDSCATLDVNSVTAKFCSSSLLCSPSGKLSGKLRRDHCKTSHQQSFYTFI